MDKCPKCVELEATITKLRREHGMTKTVMLCVHHDAWYDPKSGCLLCKSDGLTAELATLRKRLSVAEEALREDRTKWSFDALLFMAEWMLQENYPADVFDRWLKDPGPALCKALREAVVHCKAAMQPAPTDTPSSKE